MSFFRKKKRAVGKGTDKVVTLRKEFEVLNCTPIDYMYSTDFIEFIKKIKNELKQIIQKLSIDELCEDVMDYYIDSKINEMKAIAKEQYTYHMEIIHQHKGLLDGELARARGHYNNLEGDLEELEKELKLYKEIKEAKHIF